MTERLLVGIDAGTSSCKVVVLASDGTGLSVARVPTPWHRRGQGSFLDADALVGTVLDACRAALTGLEGTVVGVGVASMAEAGFLHDSGGRALAPTTSWNDDGSSGELASLRDGLPRFTSMTGLPVTARPTAVTHRARFARDPLLDRAAGWLNVAEYVVHALGGERVSEPSLASRTGWLDVERVGWWSESLDWSGITERQLPPLVAAGTPVGRAAGPAPLHGAALTVAGHDHLCAAVGIGAVTAADVVDSCGSAEALVRTVVAPPDSGLRRKAAALGFTSGRHVLSDRFALIGGFPSGARLAVLASRLGFGSPHQADAAAAGSTGSVTVPTLEQVDGWIEDLAERPPPDPDTAARWWRAAVEAIAAQAADRLEQLTALTGPADRVFTTGGSAGSGLVAAARARRIPGLRSSSVAEAAGRGAALFAAVAAEVDLDETVPLRRSLAAWEAPT